MRKVLSFFCLTVLVCPLFAQNLKTHTGKVDVRGVLEYSQFNNCTETYTYYLDKYDHEIRNGSYSLTGSYTETYEGRDQGVFMSVTIKHTLTVTATYKDDKYNGAFKYKETITQNIGEYKTAVAEYLCTFKDGEATIPCYSKKTVDGKITEQCERSSSKFNYQIGRSSVTGQYDSNGRATGKWIINGDWYEMLNGYCVSEVSFNGKNVSYETNSTDKTIAMNFANGTISFDDLIKQDYVICNNYRDGYITYDEEAFSVPSYFNTGGTIKSSGSGDWNDGFIKKSPADGVLSKIMDLAFTSSDSRYIYGNSDDGYHIGELDGVKGAEDLPEMQAFLKTNIAPKNNKWVTINAGGGALRDIAPSPSRKNIFFPKEWFNDTILKPAIEGKASRDISGSSDMLEEFLSSLILNEREKKSILDAKRILRRETSFNGDLSVLTMKELRENDNADKIKNSVNPCIEMLNKKLTDFSYKRGIGKARLNWGYSPDYHFAFSTFESLLFNIEPIIDYNVVETHYDETPKYAYITLLVDKSDEDQSPAVIQTVCCWEKDGMRIDANSLIEHILDLAVTNTDIQNTPLYKEELELVGECKNGMVRADPELYYKYASLLISGDVIKQNLTEAEYYLMEAARSPKADANIKSAAFYTIGNLYSAKNDNTQALKYYESAAKLGRIDAINRVAYCYAKGEGTNQNLEMAHQWIDIIINADVSDEIKANAYDSKGEFYLMAKNKRKAKEMLNKALSLDPSFAHNNSVLYQTFYPNSSSKVSEKTKSKSERIAAEKAAEEQRLVAEKAEAERIAAEKAEAERIAAEKAAEEQRLVAEKAEAERIAAEKAEAERLAAEKAEAERLEAAKVAEEQQKTTEKNKIAEQTPVVPDAQVQVNERSFSNSGGIYRKGRKLYLSGTNTLITINDLYDSSSWTSYQKGASLMKAGIYCYVASGVSAALIGTAIAYTNYDTSESVMKSFKDSGLGVAVACAVPVCAVAGIVLRMTGKSMINRVANKQNGTFVSSVSISATPTGIGLAYRF